MKLETGYFPWTLAFIKGPNVISEQGVVKRRLNGCVFRTSLYVSMETWSNTWGSWGVFVRLYENLGSLGHLY